LVSYKEAMPLLKEIYETDPNCLDYDKLEMLEQAIDLIDRDDLDEALPLLKTIIEINPKGDFGYFGYIEREMFEQAIEELPCLAIKLMKAQRYNEAVPLLKAILEKEPNCVASCNLQYCYFELKLFEQAIAVFNEHVAKYPQDANAYYNLGCAYSDQKIYELYELAIQNYTKAIELDPKHVSAYDNRGNGYRDQKMYDLAIRDHTKAIELDPKHAPAYIANSPK